MAFFSEITSSNPLLLVGAGNMGGALLKGWLSAGLKAREVILVDPRARDIIQKLGVRKLSALDSLRDYDPGRVPRVVVFAVKPQVMPDVFKAAHSIPLGNTLLISIAAATRISAFEKKFGKSFPVVRAMPNTPAAIGRGITAIIGNRTAGAKDLDLAERLMGCVGKVVRVERESDIDVVTCLSGSGPAYFYYMVEALSEAGFAAGLGEDLARQLACETLVGAAALLGATGEEAAALRRKVTSPGGTTEAALEVLMADEVFVKLMEKAVLTAVARSRELAG